jgi:TPR repeat protein
MMAEDGKGLTKDAEVAAAWYGKSANQGNPWAQYRLAELYRQGTGVVADISEAVVLYQKAIDQGNEWAAYQLAGLYEEGKGVSQNFTTAAELYEKAARASHSWAQFKLASLYTEGKGVGVDYVQAWYWNNIQKESGFSGAKFSADLNDRLTKFMSSAQLQKAKDLLNNAGE